MSRDINETKFSFKAFRNLKKGLGEFDAVVECNEMAIREFLNNLKASLNKEQFINDLSQKHGIIVDTVSTELFSSRIRLFYILSVMQRAEQFFDEFKKEYKSYNDIAWIEKVDGDTDFDTLLKNIYLSKGQGIDGIGIEIYHGFEYYRLIRNRFAHSEEKDLKKLNNQCIKITAYSAFYTTTFHSIDCPNTYDKMDFNDFLLFTNIIKNIGYTLCEKCKPDNLVLAKTLVNLEIEVGSKIIKPLKSLFKHKNDLTRFSNAVGNLLNSSFGKINNADKEEIIQHINRILA
ncbi:MAG TPA: hypothetical protein VFC67_12955 [Prolixibacteraceae bacterium]|nr:hypothetical protein [Prolixibacteraceae bacterium]